MSTSEPSVQPWMASANDALAASRGSDSPRTARSRSERIRSTWQPAFVGLVWLAMAANAVRFIARYGSRNMFLDDLWLAIPRFDGNGLTWATLWWPHNEHREPLPQLLQYALYRATGDARSGLWLTLFVLAVIALVMIVLARRMRGRTAWTDALFPVLWLQTGNAENLLMGYQVSLMLPVALVSLMLMLIATAPDGLRRKSVVACAIVIVCQPLCGGPGFLQAPVLAVWAFVTGRAMRRRSDDESRRSGAVLVATSVITVALLGLYLVGLRNPPNTVRTYTFAAIGELTLNVLGLALGPAAETWKPWAGVGVLIFALTGLAVALRAWSTNAGERTRAFGIACCLLANGCIALGIGVGRSGHGGPYDFAIRYVGLTAPIVCAAYVAWTLYGSRSARSIACAGAFAACTCAFLFVGCAAGERIGAKRKNAMDALERDIAADVPAAEIIDRYNVWLDGDPHRLFFMYSHMAKARIEPFDRASKAEIRSFAQEAEGVAPSRVEGLVMVAGTGGGGSLPGLQMARGSRIVFDVPDAASKMMVGFAFPVTDDPALRGTSARFFVTLSHTGFKQRDVLLSRELDPTTPASDRTLQEAEIALPPHEHRQVAMQFIMPQTAGGKTMYGRVVEVRFE